MLVLVCLKTEGHNSHHRQEPRQPGFITWCVQPEMVFPKRAAAGLKHKTGVRVAWMSGKGRFSVHQRKRTIRYATTSLLRPSCLRK
jgi:hypothetical protein